MKVEKVLKHHFKMDLVGSLHWKHLPCQSIKMIISEYNSETVKKLQTRLS